jgi:hypothetical protein
MRRIASPFRYKIAFPLEVHGHEFRNGRPFRSNISRNTTPGAPGASLLPGRGVDKASQNGHVPLPLDRQR